jgi:opacity protein-like surface antigen
VSFAITVVSVAVGSLLAVAPSKPASRGSISGGWLTLSPGGVAIPGPGATPDLRVFDRAVVAGYRWGFGLGLAFEPVEHLLVAASGSFSQSVWMFDNERGYELCFRGGCYGSNERAIGHLVRLGAELRLGWTSRYVLAWGLFGAHVGLARVRLDCENNLEPHCDRAETDLGPGLRGGVGFALRPTSRFAIGLESGIDHTWLGRRDDPFSAVRSLDVSLLAIVAF